MFARAFKKGPGQSAVGLNIEGLSIIIPTKNSAVELDRLLSSIERINLHSCETIVVDNHSSDDTRLVVGRHRAKMFISGPERSSQRNLGAEVSSQPLLLFLDSDMEVTSETVSAALRQISKADAVIIRELGTGRGLVSRAKEFERRAYFGFSLYEAARLIRKSIFEQLGGYDTRMTGQEDLDFQARIEENGYRLAWSEVPIIHHEESLTFRSYLAKRRYYGATDRIYVRKNPRRWSRQKAVGPRLKLLLGAVTGPADLLSLAALICVRCTELMVRPLQVDERDFR